MGLFSGLGKIVKGVAGSIPVVGGIASGVFDAIESRNAGKRDDRALAAQDAINRERMALDRERLGLDRSQFDATMGLNRDKLAQDERQFQSQFGLERDKFGKEKETEQFGRARNARFAKVRSPFIGGLLSGRTIADDPQAQQRLARIGG